MQKAPSLILIDRWLNIITKNVRYISHGSLITFTVIFSIKLSWLICTFLSLPISHCVKSTLYHLPESLNQLSFLKCIYSDIKIHVDIMWNAIFPNIHFIVWLQFLTHLIKLLARPKKLFMPDRASTCDLLLACQMLLYHLSYPGLRLIIM